MKNLIGGMNNEELAVLAQCPMLTRVSSNEKPCLIQLWIPANHNPDFVIGNPAEHKGIWVEVKGHVRNKNWLPILEALPEEYRVLYKVVWVNSNKQETARTTKKLDALGIEWSRKFEYDWLNQAVSLMGGDSATLLGQPDKLNLREGKGGNNVFP